METLLAILLYMQLIQSPGTYQQTYIDNLENQYHHEIQDIMDDPAQMVIVDTEYRPLVNGKIVISQDEVRIKKPITTIRFVDHELIEYN